MALFNKNAGTYATSASPAPSTNFIQNVSDVSGQQAQTIVDDVLKMVQQNLEGYKKMAGVQPGQPLKTMAYQQMENNNARQKLSDYTALTGNVPNAEKMADWGLTGFEDIAGQPTYDTKIQQLKLQDQLARGGSGGTSRSSSANTGNASSENTQDFINQIMKFRTLEYANAYFSKNYEAAQSAGVNMDYVMKKIKERWGTGPKEG